MAILTEFNHGYTQLNSFPRHLTKEC